MTSQRSEEATDRQDLSLLWPEHTRPTAPSARNWPGNSIRDTGLSELLEFFKFSSGVKPGAVLAEALLDLCTDPQVIEYRQAVLEDVLFHPQFESRLKEVIPQITTLTDYVASRDRRLSPLHEVSWRLGELELYLQCVEGLLEAMGGVSFHSQGFRDLQSHLTGIQQDPLFASLKHELPEMQARFGGLASISIGVNLDAQFKPVEATLLGVHGEAFKGAPLLGRLFGTKPRSGSSSGLGPLHVLPFRQEIINGASFQHYERQDTLLHPLFADLARIIGDVAKPISKALAQYTSLSGKLLSRLEPEFHFYLGAVSIIRKLQNSGLPLCKPQIAPMSERTCQIQQNYNINLALRHIQRTPDENLQKTIITNTVDFGEEGRVFLITGPNRGGKTTYTQAVSLTQALFQAGWYVPGSHARISPVDHIYTHFPMEERPDLETGRFGEEASRLGDIFQKATRYSLILLNESLTSTNLTESLFLAEDVVRGLRLLGARAIFNTHLHELARNASRINQDLAGEARVVSLVAEVQTDSSGEIQPTYQVRPGLPQGVSYARRIAAQHGISFEKIAQTLQDRGEV
ncbi:MutS-related protein [Deinococcus cellulosilyticus]|uniref:DNA mismatch repair proteins mutS family domain-containing protein n=1 Tax=Deinococcus cellulosilyticus (strain DSM 18568 / NBRC 106333 / KACC 11606 / 5516J-15) TaxID=1223518 RepID=A0A511MWA5_DEIC1|nr:hypothetical protein [Deinococcus cellulosilyticus]GEM44859.1 hypothetical protein DC3_04940 [Deinococcus cellulosilyticus NBRC 106333 = KACC 11606]